MDREREIGVDLSGYSEEKKDRAADQIGVNINKTSGNIFWNKRNKKKEENK